MKHVSISMLLSIIAALSITACASDPRRPSESDEGDEDDAVGGVDPEEENPAGGAIFVPPPNGKHITEGEACEALMDAQDSKINALECLITTRVCPSLLRVMTSEKCVQYDEGSMQGCINRYKAQKSCDDLEDAIRACVVTFYPGTVSAGCS